jgi:uncharacterized protein (TIGR02266 family)
MGDSLERRQDTRIELSIAVEVRDESGDFTIHSTRDISEGGVFFDRAIPQPVGAAVKLEFRLPGESTPIKCDGQVVNVPDTQGYGMGINFVFLKPADRARIEAFVRSRTPGGNG